MLAAPMSQRGLAQNVQRIPQVVTVLLPAPPDAGPGNVGRSTGPHPADNGDTAKRPAKKSVAAVKRLARLRKAPHVRLPPGVVLLFH